MAVTMAANKLRDEDWTVQCAEKPNSTLCATRGAEVLTMMFRDNVCVSQDYSLWDVDHPPLPPGNDAFTASEWDEVPDKALVRALAGMRVFWWNNLAQKEEMAIVGNKIQITHMYNGIGDETPADRIIKFTTHGEGSFRAFRIGALMRVRSVGIGSKK
jgi:hypothetical protein